MNILTQISSNIGLSRDKTFIKRFLISLLLLSGVIGYGQIPAEPLTQENDSIINVNSGITTVKEDTYPGAVIYLSDNTSQVYMQHQGIEMWCDQAIFYKKDNFIRALGNVRMNQGDTITMNSTYAEYDGNSQRAFASGKVNMRSPESTLQTDTLFFNRVKQEAYYRSGGTVRDTASTLKSRVGRFFINEKKYQFLDNVVVTNPDYTINSDHINFYNETGHAYLYGPSTITGTASTVYCERGFYDTRADEGYFVKNSKIDYNNRTVLGDSLYFNRDRNFASATNNIVVLDTLNNSVIKGHYAEVFRDKDSVFITKRALAISVQDRDSVYIHADTLMVTGPEDNRIVRGFKDVRIFKSDLSGRADSIFSQESTGLTKLIKKPVLWSGKSQITGDSIHLKSNTVTEQLDSLRVFYNAFVIDKDTITPDSYNQIKGKELIGEFTDNELSKVNIYKNVENLMFNNNESNELIGVNKGTSARMEILFDNRDMSIVRNYGDSADKTYPPEELPQNARKLRGFQWRGEEKINSVNEIFKGKPLPKLTPIKGLPLPKLEDNFFDPEEEDPSENSRLTPNDLKNRKEDLQKIGEKSD